MLSAKFCLVFLFQTLTANQVTKAESRSGGFPKNWADEKIQYIPCGKGVNLAELNYYVFGLDSPDQECEILFAGSQQYECTPGIYCVGKVGWANIGHGGTYDKFIRIEDGHAGEVAGYGDFHFDGQARLPLAGWELFLTYQGVIPSRFKCLAFCKEDLNPVYHGFSTTLLYPSENYDYPKQGKCQCGIENNVQIPYGSYPWLAAIGDPKLGDRLSFCTGALITDRHIITAASCVHDLKGDQRYYVLLHAFKLNREPGNFSKALTGGVNGWNDPELTDEDEKTTRIEFEKSHVVIHPLFQENVPTFDIAIIRLPTTVEFNKAEAWPICLANPGEILPSTAFYFGDLVMTYLGGWGRGWYAEDGEVRPRVRNLRVQGPIMGTYRNTQTFKYEECKINESPADTGFCMAYKCSFDIGSPVGVGKWRENGVGSFYGLLSGSVCEKDELPRFHDGILSRGWVYYETFKDSPQWCTR